MAYMGSLRYRKGKKKQLRIAEKLFPFPSNRKRLNKKEEEVKPLDLWFLKDDLSKTFYTYAFLLVIVIPFVYWFVLKGV